MKVDISLKTENRIDYEKYLIDLSKEIIEPQPLISLAGVPLFTRENISCISGEAKSRKTFLICLLSAQFLEYADTERIIIFDTEQAPYHVRKVAKRIHKLLEWNEKENSKQLKVFSLRELNTEERLKFVEGAIIDYKADLIFIDGIRDLVNDFNNVSECTDLVNLLMRLSSVYNCHICSVLHTNKINKELRGHTGSELSNKSESVILVEKDGDISAVSPKSCRNIPFEKFYFKINDEGLPAYCEPEIKLKNTDELKELFTEILPQSTIMRYTELRNKIKEHCKIKTDRGAEIKIDNATKQKIIAKNSIGHYHLFISELSEQTQIF